jgi:two-component system nitrate/nitrite response regulator NarL
MTQPALPHRIVLADDHPIFLSGLANLIRSDSRYALLATCSDGAAALQALRDLQPDLAVLDIGMPDMSGLDVLETARRESLPTRVVFLTASANDEYIARAVALETWGVLLKDAAADQLLAAVVGGRRWLPPEVVDKAVAREAARHLEADRIVGSLTRRERELVVLATEGLSNKEIARRVGVTEATVKIHLHNIYQKLGVTNRTVVTMLVHRRQILTGTAPGPSAVAQSS